MESYTSSVNRCPPTSSGNAAVRDLEAWFGSEGTSVHEAYGVETYYAADQSRFIPGSEPPVVHLKQVLVTFGRIQTPNQLATTHNDQFNLAQPGSLDLLNCSWEDVLDQLEAAKSESLKPSKRTGRRADRLVDKAEPYMQPWVELVPEEYGLGVIKGGLALLFALSTSFFTARHKEQNREKIIQTFEEIPDMIRTMDAAYKLFGRDDDEDISGIAESFYDELCKDIPVLIQILNGTRKRFSQVMNRLAGGLPETETVDGVLERLMRKSAELGSTISRIKMKLQAKTHADLQLIRSSVEEASMGIAAITGQLGGLAGRQDLEQLTQRNNRNLVQFASVFGTQLIDSLRQEVRSDVQAIVKDHSAVDFAAEAKTMVLRMAQENAALKDHIAAQSLQIEYNRSRQPSPRPSPAISVLDLMQILDVDPRSCTDDLTLVTSKEDHLSGPHGMLRSLIAQLVLSFKAPLPNLSAIDSHEFLQDCYNRTLPALCEVFRLLVDQIPQGVGLYVLVDGVSWYEQTHWAADLMLIVGLFKDLTEPNRSSLFKVLLTSPSRTIEVQTLVDFASEYVSLAPGNMDYTPLVSYSMVQSMFNKG
ncbi:uncharacterized protein PG986_002251 [Apiospora aurea]|uniref:Uncharacterized protein n=1 Tax=Apiospora aurea TaxID=335848 RepID=A0ABR1QZB4_9PEZI